MTMFSFLIGAAVGAAALYAYNNRSVIVGDIHTEYEAAVHDLESIESRLLGTASKANNTADAHANLAAKASSTASAASALASKVTAAKAAA